MRKIPLKSALPSPKPRADSTLDARLSPTQADDFLRRLDQGLSLEEASRWLAAEIGVTLSLSSISRWASRRRRERSEQTFACLFETVRQDTLQARAIGTTARDIDKLYGANEVLLNQALFVAQRNNDPIAMEKALDGFARAVTAMARARQARANLIAAEEKRRSGFDPGPEYDDEDEFVKSLGLDSSGEDLPGADDDARTATDGDKKGNDAVR